MGAAQANVGDQNNATGLRDAIMNVYNSGASSVTINPGQYVLPDNGGVSFTLSGITHPFEIDGYNVEIVLKGGGSDGVYLNNDTGLVMKGLTLDRGAVFGNQGVITAYGADSVGVWEEVQCDAGYPTDGWGFDTVLVGSTHSPRPGCYDLGWAPPTGAVEQLGGNKVRIHHQNPKNWNGWTIQAGDYLVSCGGAQPVFHAEQCAHCSFIDFTFPSSPSWCTIREDTCTANYYYNDKITYGPAPAGGSKPQMRSVGSGFQGVGDYVGPDVENCLFEGTGDDGFDLRGYLDDITAVSGKNITVSGGAQWSWHDPIRLSDNQGHYQDAVVNGINGSTLTLDQTVLVAAGNGGAIQSAASNPNRNCGGYKLINDTVRDNRARGMLVRGDNGLIQGCTLTNNSMPGILLGLEGVYGWHEGDYSHNVAIDHNIITGSAYAYGSALYINGSGSLGNQNITVSNNIFQGNYGQGVYANGAAGLKIQGNVIANQNGPDILINGDNGVQVLNNTFANVGQVQNTDGHTVTIQASANVTLANNLVTNPGAYASSPLWSVDGSSSNIAGLSPAGQATAFFSNEHVTLTNMAAGLNLDDPGSTTTRGTLMQLYTPNGGAAQNWKISWQPDGSCSLLNQAANLVLDDIAYGGQGTYQQLWPYSGVTAQKWWLTPTGPSSYTLTNEASGLVLDDPNSSTSVGQHVWLWPANGGAAQSWQVKPSPGQRYTLTNLAAGLNLDDPNFSTAPGTLPQLVSANGYAAQNWMLNWQSNASVTLTNQAGNLNLGRHEYRRAGNDPTAHDRERQYGAGLDADAGGGGRI